MEDEINIKRLCIDLWRKKWIILSITIIFAIIGVFKYGNIINKTQVIVDKKSSNMNEDLNIVSLTFYFGYYTPNQILKNDQQITENGQIIDTKKEEVTKGIVSITPEFVGTCNGMIKSSDVLSKIISKYNLEIEQEELVKLIGISQQQDSKLLKLYVVYDDESIATNIATELLNELEIKLKNLFKIDNIYIADSAHLLNKTEIEELEKISSEKSEDETVSVVPTSTTNTRNTKKIIIFALIGFIASCGVCLVLDLFNENVKDVETLEKATGLKTLTTLNKKDINNEDRIKLLRVNIKECQTILITSSSKNEGKTYVAENLAKSFAKLNKKVLLLDLTKNESDLVKKYNGKGLANFLNSQDKFVEKYAVETSVKNLSIILAGKDENNMTELLESAKMQETLSTLERLYDVIIIDSENVIESANTLAIAKIAKYSILVAEEGKTKLDKIIRAKNNIEDIGGNVIGSVLNKIYKA